MFLHNSGKRNVVKSHLPCIKQPKYIHSCITFELYIFNIALNTD